MRLSVREGFLGTLVWREMVVVEGGADDLGQPGPDMSLQAQG